MNPEFKFIHIKIRFNVFFFDSISRFIIKANISKKYKRLICKQRLNKNEFLIKKFEIE